MSLYAQYITERTNDLILETDKGFATYRYVPGDKVYIIDIFVLPEHRKRGHAAELANAIAKEAFDSRKAHTMIGTVIPSAKGSTQSTRVLLAFGMKLVSSTTDLIIFEKKI